MNQCTRCVHAISHSHNTFGEESYLLHNNSQADVPHQSTVTVLATSRVCPCGLNASYIQSIPLWSLDLSVQLLPVCLPVAGYFWLT